jgi:hypothetical protein
MNSITDDIIISQRFRGPPDTANGGYACGVLAKRMQGDARVRLQSPPPLETRLNVRGDAGGLRMLDGELVIAEAVTVDLVRTDLPEPVSYDVAQAAATRFRWYTGHPFATCFVCGPERHAHDGLCIFTGRVEGRDVVAAPWTPDQSVCDESGSVNAEVVWAALDCPSWFGILEFQAGVRWALLGQLSAHVARRPLAGEKCVVTGWSRGREGRKLFGGAGLFTGAGELLGYSDAIWIELKK